MTVAKRISRCRKDKGLSQEYIAEVLEVSRQTGSKWETGVVVPDTYNMVKLAKLFDVSVEYLTCGGEKVEYAPHRKLPSDKTTPREASLQEKIEEEEEKEERETRRFRGFVCFMLGLIFLVRHLFLGPTLAGVLTWTLMCIFGLTKIFLKPKND